ncbi:MAG: peptidyl-prolyl cis-trans isomerase, partial [Gelidibacter sp.]|nr:peptidyl-prolyl cis-trans isomerase [Gelidibacter sp.]
ANRELFKVGTKVVTYNDFANHLLGSQKVYFEKSIPFSAIVEKEYNAFQESTILKYHEDNLEFENEDFGLILKEYRDGLLLFDLMEKEVWNAASTDTLGLKSYYDKHASNYVWNTRIDAIVASSAKKEDMLKVKNMLESGQSSDDISTALNTESEQKVIFTKGTMEVTNQSLPSDLELKEGVSKIYNYNDAFHVILIDKIVPTTNKTFEEARGKVVSDYQSFIEENWIKGLNERYKVEINDAELSKVKSQIKTNKN